MAQSTFEPTRATLLLSDWLKTLILGTDAIIIENKLINNPEKNIAKYKIINVTDMGSVCVTVCGLLLDLSCSRAAIYLLSK